MQRRLTCSLPGILCSCDVAQTAETHWKCTELCPPTVMVVQWWVCVGRHLRRSSKSQILWRLKVSLNSSSASSKFNYAIAAGRWSKEADFLKIGSDACNWKWWPFGVWCYFILVKMNQPFLAWSAVIKIGLTCEKDINQIWEQEKMRHKITVSLPTICHIHRRKLTT